MKYWEIILLGSSDLKDSNLVPAEKYRKIPSS